MASSDDEGDIVPHTASNYHFVDANEEPISFAELPIQWSEDDDDNTETNQKQVFLRGTADGGLQKLYKQVSVWKFDLADTRPYLSVLTKENIWMKLEKPRKSYEPIIRSILITIQCLQFLRKNPEASGKSLWSYLAKSFSLYEIPPSENDLVNHMPVITKAVERDESLKTCKLILSFLEEKPTKRKTFDEAAQPTSMAGFIVDDTVEDADEEGSDEEVDMFDSVCAFCDNGGVILCCEGKCLRSFHATIEAGEESSCASLCMTQAQVDAMSDFHCKNCQHNQHQCFVCGKLGSSDKSAGAEVYQCVNATCGHFYHPICVAKWLHRENEDAAKELQEKIAAGESFTCPAHKCFICKQIEDKNNLELQFAVCRRCPKAYHRKCLPRKIPFEDSVEENIPARAWEGLLPNRILIYCLKHAIVEDIGTPSRNHIKFPYDEEKRKSRPSDLALDTQNKTLKRKSLVSEAESSQYGNKEHIQVEKPISSLKERSVLKRNREISSAYNTQKKVKGKCDLKKPLRDYSKSAPAKSDKSSARDEKKVSLGDQLYTTMVNKGSEHVKLKRQDLDDNDHDNVETVGPSAKKLSSSSYQLDADSEKRLLALMKESTSSITLEQIKEKHKAPSTHAYSSKFVVEKVITQGKLDGAVEAIRAALQKLEAGCSLEDAKAVCEPEVLNQLAKWKNKLKVYLAPFLHGMRYTSYGRHFTKIDKLEEIVGKLHGYVQDGDMIVDFCCGANDFSCIMKNKLEMTGKKCFYKNYDILTAKNDFNFEQRDWMEVQPRELPNGSQLIMGLNPPFGVHASLANKFIDKALKFKPKLVILIVPPETERLDKKRTPYDLIWEDDELLLGKSFYLPGSVDENDKQIGQWNNETPPLYLWSRPDWTVKHKAIASKLGHLSRLQQPDDPSSMEDHIDKNNLMMLKDDDDDDIPVSTTANAPPPPVVTDDDIPVSIIEVARKESSGGCDKDESNTRRRRRCDNNNNIKEERKSHLDVRSSKYGRSPKDTCSYRNNDALLTTTTLTEKEAVYSSSSTHEMPREIEMPMENEMPREIEMPMENEMPMEIEMPKEIEDEEDTYKNLAPLPGIGLQFEQQPYTTTHHHRWTIDDPIDNNTSLGYMTDFEQRIARKSEIRARVQQFGGHDSSSYASPPQRNNYNNNNYVFDPRSRNQLSSFNGTNNNMMSAMERYAPRLDQTNHSRLNDVYDPRRRVQPNLRFAPAPAPDQYHHHHNGFSHQSSTSGWIND